MKGLKLHCLYAYGCDMATMLGVNEVLKGFAKGDIANAPAIIRIIEKLKYFPRIPEIAEKLNKGIFSKEVAREYWLKRHTAETLVKILGMRERADLPELAIQKLLDSTISWGRIIDGTTVETKRVLFREDGFYLSEDKISVGSLIPLEFLQKGDFVSIHLESIREKLTEEQGKILLEANQEAIKQIAP